MSISFDIPHLNLEFIGSNNHVWPDSMYWGTAPTGMPHIGYMIPFGIMRKYIENGGKLRILIADRHALLEGIKKDVLSYRVEVYRIIIEHFLGDVDIVLGSDFQRSAEYSDALLMAIDRTSIMRATRASSGVIKEKENPSVGGITYPIMQALDDIFMQTKGQLGGVDQRRIFALSNEMHPGLIHVTHRMMGTADSKMSASSLVGKIAFNFSNKKIRRAVSQMNTAHIATKDDMLMQIVRECANFPVSVPQQKPNPRIVIDTFDDLQQEYLAGNVTVQDINILVTEILIDLITPIRDKLSAQLLKNARFDV